MKGISFIIILQSLSMGAQNLVPNPGFEDTLQCPGGISQFYAANWYSPTYGTPDYFNSCSNQVGVPQNFIGWEQARNGVAYAGVCTRINPKGREYIQARLTDTLVSGIRYKASFYISLADSTEYACNNIGAYLSKTAISALNDWPLSVTPQITNDPVLNSLENPIGWTLVVDTFTASGGELYITIGNFIDPNFMDTVYHGGSYSGIAYYYIDDVSVYTNDSLNSLGLQDDLINSCFDIYPNPSSGIVNLKWFKPLPARVSVEVANVLGRVVHSFIVEDSSPILIDLQDQMSGIYFLQIKTERGIASRKIIIQR